MTNAHSGQSQSKGGYDRRDVNVRMLLLWASAVVLFIVVALALLDSWFILTKEEVISTTVLKPDAISLEDLRTREDQVLTSYKTLDSIKGVYQIPVERALELTASEAARYQTTK